MFYIKVSTTAIAINHQKIKEGDTTDLLPAIMVAHWKGGTRFDTQTYHKIRIDGPCEVIQDDINGGLENARVWIETPGPITVLVP